jgi:hypothetical protein
MPMHWLQKTGHRPIRLIEDSITRIYGPGFRDENRPKANCRAHPAKHRQHHRLLLVLRGADQVWTGRQVRPQDLGRVMFFSLNSSRITPDLPDHAKSKTFPDPDPAPGP